MPKPIQITLFKYGSKQFLELLRENDIPFRLRRPEPGNIMLSGEWVEIIRTIGEVSIIPSLAAIIIQWLKSRAARIVMIQTEENQVIRIEGYSPEQVEQVLETSRSIMIIQTEPDQVEGRSTAASPRPKERNKMVFISYAREDYDFAKRIYDDLNAVGLSPWLDTEEILPGEDWRRAISTAIEKSAAFLALISSNSVDKRGHVQKELRQAIQILEEMPPRAIYLIPVRLEEIIPAHGRLSELQWLDLFPDYDDKVIDKLVAAVSHATGSDISESDIGFVRALFKLRKRTQLVYPGLERCTKFGGHDEDLAIRTSTLEEVRPELEMLAQAGLISYDVGHSSRHLPLTSLYFKSVDRARLNKLLEYVPEPRERLTGKGVIDIDEPE